MIFRVQFLIDLRTMGRDVIRVFIFPLPTSSRHSNIRLLPFVTITTVLSNFNMIRPVEHSL